MASRGGFRGGAAAPARGGGPAPGGARGGAVGGGAAPAAASSSGGAGKDANVHHLAKCITCHSWSGDRSRLALCPNDNSIEIWQFDGSAWNKEFVLDEHDQIVTGLDWAPKTNRLVSCSEDRNAYVWTFQEGYWKPTLVILRINRAATHVKWSPNEDKFAVASGAKVVSVCYFEEENDWWVSKHIKKHRSTVLCVDWHPSNLLLLTGAADFTARIFSAAVKGVDKKPRDNIGSFAAASIMQFGEQLMEMSSAQGWVHSARFSPSGQMVAFVSHDSSISFCDITNAENQPWRYKHVGLPFQTCMFLNEQTVVAAGHEYKPYLFQLQGDGSWALTRSLDEKKAAAGGPAKVNAFAMFQNKVATGQGERKGDKQETKHQNCITYLDVYQGSTDNVAAFTSSGIDGLVVVWSGQGGW